MKTKTYLFRIIVGALAFLFSLGVFSTWRYLQTPALTAPLKPTTPAMTQDDSIKLRETYPLMPSATKDAPPPAVEPANDEAEAEFDAEGSYQIAGDAPKGFKDFESFTIANKNYKSEDQAEYGKLIAPQGYVFTDKEFKFNKISIGSEQIQFETERVKGISYAFSGRFTETRNFVYLEPEAAGKVLEGRLIKKRNGKKIADAQVQFGWYIETSCGC